AGPDHWPVAGWCLRQQDRYTGGAVACRGRSTAPDRRPPV
ncbi:MAG: hypothetical protein AVDCRST_MAG49-1127, partial [uncultured Thermomicrobiales bacterium]